MVPVRCNHLEPMLFTRCSVASRLTTVPVIASYVNYITTVSTLSVKSTAGRQINKITPLRPCLRKLLYECKIYPLTSVNMHAQGTRARYFSQTGFVNGCKLLDHQMVDAPSINAFNRISFFID